MSLLSKVPTAASFEEEFVKLDSDLQTAIMASGDLVKLFSKEPLLLREMTVEKIKLVLESLHAKPALSTPALPPPPPVTGANKPMMDDRRSWGVSTIMSSVRSQVLNGHPGGGYPQGHHANGAYSPQSSYPPSGYSHSGQNAPNGHYPRNDYPSRPPQEYMHSQAPHYQHPGGIRGYPMPAGGYDPNHQPHHPPAHFRGSPSDQYPPQREHPGHVRYPPRGGWSRHE